MVSEWGDNKELNVLSFLTQGYLCHVNRGILFPSLIPQGYRI